MNYPARQGEYTDRISLIKNKRVSEKGQPMAQSQDFSHQQAHLQRGNYGYQNFGPRFAQENLPNVGDPIPLMKEPMMHRSLGPGTAPFAFNKPEIPHPSYNKYYNRPHQEGYAFKSNPPHPVEIEIESAKARYENFKAQEFKPKALSGHTSPSHKRNSFPQKPTYIQPQKPQPQPQPSQENLIPQMKEAIRENDKLLSENEQLQRGLGFVNSAFLNQIETMLIQKETLKNTLSTKTPPLPTPHPTSKVSENLSNFLLTENKKLKELIASYSQEHNFLSSRISSMKGKSN